MANLMKQRLMSISISAPKPKTSQCQINLPGSFSTETTIYDSAGYIEFKSNKIQRVSDQKDGFS